MSVGNILGKNWRLIAFLLSIIVVFALLYALRSAIFPFVLGLVIAYLLLPVIHWVEKRLPLRSRWQQTERVSLIVIILIAILGLVSILAFYVVNAVVNAFMVLINNAPLYISGGLLRYREWIEIFRQQFPPEMQLQIDQFILNVGTALGNAIREAFTRGVAFIPTTVGLVFGFAALPIFLFYILKDAEQLKRGFYSAISPLITKHTGNIVSIIEEVLGRYIRAQIMLGFIVAYFCFVGLIALGMVRFAPALAVFAGVTELIPTLGPWIGGAAAVIVTLAVAPEKAIWVALLYLIIQLVENTLLVPRIQGAYLRIHPAFVILLIVLGAYVAGFWGILLAVPLTATIMEIYKYVRRCMMAEETQ